MNSPSCPPDPSVPNPPIDLTCVSAVGAVYCGNRVARLDIVTDGKARIGLDLPAPTPPTPPRRPTAETELGAAILAALRAAGQPLKQAELAKRMGMNPPSGHFKTVCADLVKESEMENTPEGYWFPAAD